jgi:hypothetical protein
MMADDYTGIVLWDQDGGAGEGLQHDREGYRLAGDLQDALGAAYRIDYLFETDEVRREMGHLERLIDPDVRGPRMPGR